MPQVPGDNCDNCNQWHAFDTVKDRINLFWDTPNCNHVFTTCPECGYETRIYVEFEAFCYTKLNANLTINFAKVAPDDLVTSRAAIDDGEALSTGTAKATPDPPVLWLRQLYDDLRRFERGETDEPA